MIRMAFSSPRMNAWQTRVSRIPRWGWIAVLSGLAILTVVMLIVTVRNYFRGVRHARVDDGRRNVRIAVRSVRVIDSESP